ncbi:MAG: serine/threonine protein kinase [Bradymonadia bacterium]|jgi:serine/threonine protein kinase
MGEVFLADRLSSTGVTVRCVVKTIKQGVGRAEQFESLFLDEARLISHLRHPNVVSILDVGRADGRLYLALEWVDGLDADTLQDSSQSLRGDLPHRHLLYLMRETLQGLHYAHTAKGPDGQPLNVVHRDISPGNILISRHGAVKLADFGVSTSGAGHTEGAGDTLAGKPHYFAPELWRGSTASVQTDVFALGVTFYELYKGSPLFSRDKDLRGLAFEICEFSVDEMIEADLSLPDGFEHIVRHSLHDDPAVRYASALEFLEDVNDYAYEAGVRLLDAHFAAYVERLLAPDAEKASSIWKQ